jgi:hypothetical protein
MIGCFIPNFSVILVFNIIQLLLDFGLKLATIEAQVQVVWKDFLLEDVAFLFREPSVSQTPCSQPAAKTWRPQNNRLPYPKLLGQTKLPLTPDVLGVLIGRADQAFKTGFRVYHLYRSLANGRSCRLAAELAQSVLQSPHLLIAVGHLDPEGSLIDPRQVVIAVRPDRG